MNARSRSRSFIGADRKPLTPGGKEVEAALRLTAEQHHPRLDDRITGAYVVKPVNGFRSQ